MYLLYKIVNTVDITYIRFSFCIIGTFIPRKNILLLVTSHIRNRGQGIQRNKLCKGVTKGEKDLLIKLTNLDLSKLAAFN